MPVAAVLFTLGLNAQTSPGGQSDPEAKKILDQASAKIKAYPAIQASFTFELQDAQGKAQGTKKGSFSMKGNKYKVLLTGQEIISDGTTVWTYDKSSNEVTITKVDGSSGSVSPQKLFTSAYDKDFLYKLNGDQKVAGKTVQEIEMTPVDKTLNFHKIYLYIDKATHLVSSGKMLDKSGSRYLYSIGNINGKTPIPDATFAFNKATHPGVEEVDLRQ